MTALAVMTVVVAAALAWLRWDAVTAATVRFPRDTP